MNFLPIAVPKVFWLAESLADLQEVKHFINYLEQGMFRSRNPNGGSDEYWEAFITLGTSSVGCRYVSPREDFVGLDGFIVTAITTLTNVNSIVRLNLNFNPGETKRQATRRWIAATLCALKAGFVLAGIPYLSEESESRRGIYPKRDDRDHDRDHERSLDEKPRDIPWVSPDWTETEGNKLYSEEF